MIEAKQTVSGQGWHNSYARTKELISVVFALALSGFAHVIIVVVFDHAYVPAVVSRKTQVVSIRLTKTSSQAIPTKPRRQVAPPKSLPHSAKSQSRASRGRSSSLARTKDLSPSSAAGPPMTASSGRWRYRELLPNGQETSALGQGMELAVKRAYEGKYLGELMAAASDVNADFDLPLVFRRQMTTGRAVVSVRRDEEGISLMNLGGNPEIRAALFEALREPVVLAKIQGIFAYFATHEFKVSLVYTTTPGLAAPSEFATQYKIFANEIEISLTRFPDAPKYGVSGLAIDDEHAKRARRKDAAKLRELRQSAAYRGEITKHILCHAPAC